MELYEESTSFNVACYDERGKTMDETNRRIKVIRDRVNEKGNYEHTRN